MRLLFLAPAPPCPGFGGGALRMFHLVRFLAQRFEVDLVAPALDGAEESAHLTRRFCREVVLVPPGSAGARRHLRVGPYERDPGLAETIRERLARQVYAAVHVEKPAMLPYVPGAIDIPIVLDTFAYGLTGALRSLRHEPGALTRARNLLRLVRFAVFDAWCWPETHCILVVSEPDRQRCLRARPHRKVLLIPNGVDCAEYRPGPVRDASPPLLLFTGDMAFAPNIQAAQMLAARVFPPIREAFPEAQLRIVGRNPTPAVRGLQRPGVTVTGEVPDLLPHLQAATVYVAPLTTGAGTRTKLLEALAVGLPIVTTRIGIEGIEAEDGREVALADDPDATVRIVRGLLADPSARRRQGEAARRLAESRYDWSRCLAPLEGLYVELLARRAGGC